MSRTFPRRHVAKHGAESVGIWIVCTMKRWHAAAHVYLHPCGDVILVPVASVSPLNDRLLVGTYTEDADAESIAGDVAHAQELAT